MGELRPRATDQPVARGGRRRFAAPIKVGLAGSMYGASIEPIDTLLRTRSAPLEYGPAQARFGHFGAPRFQPLAGWRARIVATKAFATQPPSRRVLAHERASDRAFSS
jgi:hypothetical protein